MQSPRSIIGLAGTLLAVIYCGGLIYYFIDKTGSVEVAQAVGLGPTLFGLGAIGLLFCVALAVKFIKIFPGPKPPASGGDGNSGPGGSGGSPAESMVDADAVIARYLASRPGGAPAGASSASSGTPPGGIERRQSFGRKVR